MGLGCGKFQLGEQIDCKEEINSKEAKWWAWSFKQAASSQEGWVE